jgi:hypothetical protein
MYLFICLFLFVYLFDLQVHVDHGGLYPDFCEVPVQKECPSPQNVFRRISGELFTWSQTVNRNPTQTSRIVSKIISVIF